MLKKEKSKRLNETLAYIFLTCVKASSCFISACFLLLKKFSSQTSESVIFNSKYNGIFKRKKLQNKNCHNFICFLNHYFFKNEKEEKKGLIFPLLAGYALKVKIIKIKQKIFWPFKHYWQQATAVLLLVCLISGLAFWNNQPKARAASYDWTQTSWDGGRDSGTYPDHTNNQSNWTKYSSEDNYIATSTDLKFKATTTATFIDFTTEGDYMQEDATNGTDFNNNHIQLSNLFSTGTGADGDLVVNGTTIVITSTKNYHDVTVINGGSITTNALSTLQIFVSGTLTIDATSNINVDGKGYAGGRITCNSGVYSGSGSGGGYNTFCTYDGGGGASYGISGGYGGGHNNGVYALPGATYGTANLSVINYGSAGGQGGSGEYWHSGGIAGNGGAGGGALQIVANNIVLSGRISANGSNGGGGGGTYGGGGGGGSGGSVFIQAVSITSNSGQILSTGGTGGAGYGGGGGEGYGGSGGSGRIRIDYVSVNGYVFGAGSDLTLINSIADPDPGYTNSSASYPITQAYYVTTATASQINTSAWNSISGATITQTTPANTSIKYLVSFDDRSTWKYWNGSSWVVSNLANLQTDGMTKTALEGLSSANWNASGGYQSGVTATLDFAMDLSTTNASATPEVDQIQISYINYVNYSTDSTNAYTNAGDYVQEDGTNGTQFSGGVVKLHSSVMAAGKFGNGADGACTISGTKNINTDTNVCNERTRGFADAVNFSVTQNTSSGQNQITLSSAPDGLSVGDEILIINLQGTSGDNSNVGLYETKAISSINSNTLTLSSILINSYNGTTQKIMVQRVPNYSNATVSGGATLTVSAWNGTKGGVLFFRVSGTLTDSGTINATGKGYRGGAGSLSIDGIQGESYGGPGIVAHTPNLGGGSGGVYCNETTGAAGGSYGSQGGQGLRDANWPVGSPTDPGSTYGEATLNNRFYFGSGGGGGVEYAVNNGIQAAGGSGGGIILISADTFTVTGSIVSNGVIGEDSTHSYSSNGGSGAGGGVYIGANTATLGTNLITAGGAVAQTGTVDNGDGGAGGNGRTVVYADSSTGTTSPSAYTGASTNIIASPLSIAEYQTSQAYYVLTANSSQSNSSSWAEISSINITQTTPANTNIKYLVSFDGRSTWKYWNGSTWAASSLDNLQTNGMSSTTLQALSSANWSASGGFQAGVTATLDFAVDLSSSNSSVTPELDQISITYVIPPFLISSAFNTQSSANILGSIRWTETLPSGTDIKFQIQTAPDNAGAPGSWSGWMGPNGTDSSYFTDPAGNESMPAALTGGNNDQWVQYKIFLSSTGINTPTLSDATLTYVVNAAPEFDATFGTNGVSISQISDSGDANWGKAQIQYKIKDTDTTSGTVTQNFVTPTFEYSLNGGGAWANVSTSTITFATAPVGGEVVDTNSDLTMDNKVLAGSYLTYTAYWDAKSQIPGNYSASFKIRVTINDNEAANATAAAIGNTAALDAKNPVLGARPISAAATSTPAGLTLSASDDSSLQMKVSLDSNFSGAGWQSYNSTSTIALATDPDTVYVLYRDAYGNQSATSTVSTPETPTAMMIQDTSNLNVSPAEYRLFLAWKVVGLPFSQYVVYRSTDNINYTQLAAVDTRATNYYGDSSFVANTLYYYKVAVADADGNVSYFSSAVSGKANGTQDAGEGGGGTETTAPTISNVATSSVYSTQATITWDTNELSDSRVDYIISTGGDFTSAPYKGSTSMLNTAAGTGRHSITLTNLSPAANYYFQVRSADVNSNTATSTYGVNGYMFTTPSGPIISATSTSDIKNYSAKVNWTTDSAASSYVVYATSTAFSYTTETGSATTATSHSVTLTGLNANTIYYYYIRSGDSIDNNAGEYYSLTTASDTTAPIITFTPATDVTVLSDTSTKIVWTTSELATSTVEYGLDTSCASSTDNANFNINQSITLANLTKGTQYYFRLKSRDGNYNQRTADNGGAGYTFTTTDSDDLTAPTVTNINANPIMDTKSVINWVTNEAATSKVEYGTTSGTYTTASSTTALDRSHSIILSNLLQNTIYYYRAISADSNSNTATSTEYSFTTSETLSEESDVAARETTARAEGVASVDNTTTTVGGGGIMYVEKIVEKVVEKIVEKIIDSNGEKIELDKTAPKISNVQVESTGSDFAVITWRTDEESDSFIQYGNDLNYHNSSYGQRDSVKTHKITLKWLNPSAIYHFRATSADSSGNVGVSADNVFTTAIFTAELADQEKLLAELEQNKDKEKALAEKENILKQTAEKAMDIFNRVASQVSIASLERTLLFQQDSIDKLANAIPAPVMSGEPKVIVSAKSATIIWQTDKEANSLVALAAATQYDSAKADPYIQVTGNADAKTKAHLVTIYNLDPETTYHYQLKSKPIIGPVSKSKDFTFTTNKETLEIQNYTMQKLSGQEAVFQWVTTVEADSVVKYAPYRNNVLAVDETKTKIDKAFTTIHQIPINDFEAGVGYQVELLSKDMRGNTVNKIIPAFFTAEDDLPPLIYQVQTESALSQGKDVRVQTIISWMTNEPATSRLYYQQGIGKENDELSKKTALDQNYTKKHVVVITDFKSGSVYRFKAESLDSGGNSAISKSFTILTPRQKETVFQVIMKNLEDTFGWVGKMSGK